MGPGLPCGAGKRGRRTHTLTHIHLGRGRGKIEKNERKQSTFVIRADKPPRWLSEPSLSVKFISIIILSGAKDKKNAREKEARQTP